MKYRLRLQELNLELCQHVFEPLLDDSRKKVFSTRMRMIELAHLGMGHKAIYSQTGLPVAEQTRLIKRFLATDEEGVVFGDRALVPGARVKPYTRRAPVAVRRSQQQGGLSGIFKLVLEKYPEVTREFVDLIMHHHSKYDGIRFSQSFYYARFLDLLKAAGVEHDEWPFNIKSGGKRTICEYIKSVLDSDFVCSALTLGHKGRTHARLGHGVEGLINASLPFDIVELDSYKVDGSFILKIRPTPEVCVSRTVERFWIIAVIEKKSRAVLAWKFVFNTEVRNQDVEDIIIQGYLGNWEPKLDLTIEGLSYESGSGMLGYILPCTKGLLWGSLYVDNALAHHAEKIKTKVRNNLGFAINYGQLGHPERRSIIENLFNQISHKIMHRIPSTTGSSPKDGRAKDPEEAAEKYEIYIEEAEELLDVWLACYNITPKSGGTYSKSPAEIITDYLGNSMHCFAFPHAHQSVLNELYLNQDVRSCVIRGGAKSGVAPHIVLDKARYTNETLSMSLALVGVRVLVKINPKDYRRVEAFLPNGEKLGVLTVLGHWRATRHSVVTRKLINRSLLDRTLELNRLDDIVVVYFKHLEKRNNRKSRLELHRLYNEMFNAPLEDQDEKTGHFSDETAADVEAPGGDVARVAAADLKAMMVGFGNIPGGVEDEQE